ncbi:MAG: MBL fold metallo-hydrolase [Nitrospirota bacterium]
MRPSFHPRLINDPFGDPGVYVEFMFERRAILFDLGDLHALWPRKILKVTHAFVSHTHMDHFVGFDQVVRVCLGRNKRIRLFGPPGLIEQVAHRLAAYTWNLVRDYPEDFSISVTEVHPGKRGVRAEFACRTAFQRQEAGTAAFADGVLVDDDTVRVRAVMLDHKVPCLAFSLEEKAHVNVWKTKLEELGLPIGPWLKGMKDAVLRGDPDESPCRVWWRDGAEERQRTVPLGWLKERVLRIVPGQKIVYVVDAVYHAENARAIVELARHADVLFIEAAFLHQDAERAAERAHLTAHQAGLLAREAGAKAMVPMHFSPRYAGQGDRLREEAERAFASRPTSVRDGT